MLQTLQALLHEAFLSNRRERLVQRRQKRHRSTTVYLYHLLVCCFRLLYFVSNPFVSFSQTLSAHQCGFFWITAQEHASYQRQNERGVKENCNTNKQMMEGEVEKKKASHTGDANVEPWAIGSTSWQAIMSGGKSFIRLTFPPHRQLSYKAEFSAVKTRCKTPPPSIPHILIRVDWGWTTGRGRPCAPSHGMCG